MYSMFGLKDGEQQCSKCKGEGCYWCRKSGMVVQCPRCNNHEPELVSKQDDGYLCLACGDRFDRKGQHVAVDDDEDNRPKQPKQPQQRRP